MQILTLNELCAPRWAGVLLDVAVVLFFVLSVFNGSKKGFIRSFFGIISTGIALILAISLAGAVTRWTGGLFGAQSWLESKMTGTFAGVADTAASVAAGLLSGVLLFVLVKLLMNALRNALAAVAEKIFLIRWADGLLGAVFGFLYASVIVFSLMALLSVLPISAVRSLIEQTTLIKALCINNPIFWLLS